MDPHNDFDKHDRPPFDELVARVRRAAKALNEGRVEDAAIQLDMVIEAAGIPEHVCGICYHPLDRCSNCGDPR